MKKIKVLIAEDHAVVRDGLKILISMEPDLEIAGEAENGAIAIRMAQKLKPDVVLMDVAMPECDGAKATQSIAKQSPAPKVLVLSAYSDEESVRRLMQAGASGYLTKQTAAEDLLRAIREVNRGNSFFSPSVARRMRMQMRQAFLFGEGAGRFPELTARETEVLQLIGEGSSNKQVAAQLNISIKTVEKHRQAIMEKLDIHETASLTRYAFSKGLLPRANGSGSRGQDPGAEKRLASACPDLGPLFQARVNSREPLVGSGARGGSAAMARNP